MLRLFTSAVIGQIIDCVSLVLGEQVHYISVEHDPYTFRGVFRPKSGRIEQVWGWRLLESSENHWDAAGVWNTLEALTGVNFIHVFATHE